MERTKMTLTLTSRRVSVETSLVTQSDTDSDSEQDEKICSYKGHGQILELSSGEAVEK